MPLSEERRREIHETTVRLEQETANRLGVIAQVLGISRNKFISQAVVESINLYEGDSEYQEKRKKWIKDLAQVGA